MPWLIVLLYAGHTINNSIHNIAWFVVCELEGGVSTGLLMGVKAASLFFSTRRDARRDAPEVAVRTSACLERTSPTDRRPFLPQHPPLSSARPSIPSSA